MRFERDDAKVGLLVLIALTLFASLAFNRALRLLLNREVLHQVALKNVSDLSVGTEVQLQGLRVGQTNAVEMRREGTEYNFVATLGIRPDVVLWRGTKGIINSRLVGGAYLELRLPPVEERRVELKPGEPIEGETASSVNSLVASLEELTRSLNQSVLELRGELKSRGLESVIGHPDVRGTLHEAISAFASFRAFSKVAEKTFTHGDGTLSVLERNMASLEKSLTIVQELLERRGTDIDELIVQLGTTLVQLRQLSVDLDALLKNAGPDAVQGLRALARTLSSMEELIEILKVKPSRVVFGTPSEKEREDARKRVEDTRRAAEPATAPTSAPAPLPK
jgi:ABC-type transporter Mla subunit MlaD